jgi:hypothetical protein
MNDFVNLVQKTGKPKGFGFLAYEDQRSTVLAVDNFNGTKVCSRCEAICSLLLVLLSECTTAVSCC